MARRKIKQISFRPVISVMLIAVIIGASIGIIRSFALRYPYFNVSTVVISGVDDSYAEIGRRLIGKNILLINLSVLKNEIQEEAPEIECLSIQKKFPDEIAMVLRKRQGIVQLRLMRFYPVDQTGMIIGRPLDLPLEGLPVILGLDAKISKPMVGRSYACIELRYAIELVQAKNNTASLKGYKLTRINFANSQVPSFFLLEDLKSGNALKGSTFKSRPEVEIRFSPQALIQAIKALGLVLEKHGGSLEGIEYIDLRNPKSPVFLEKKSRGSEF